MYSPLFLEHFHRPRNEGSLDEPDASGSARFERCGDSLRLDFRSSGDRLREVCFRSRGCGAVKAAGSAATELLLGRTLEEARSLTSLDLDQALGGVPPAKRHALWMVLECLAEALGPRPPTPQESRPPEQGD